MTSGGNPSRWGGGLVVGMILWLTPVRDGARVAWLIVAFVGDVFSVSDLVKELRAGRFGIDPLALLSIAGALLVKEFLAAAIISVMLASGRTLEQWASRRARRELQSLLGRIPTTAHLIRGDQ
ncbi:MAG: hypothetical protein HKL85_11430 [Acidimicrobiaceae bacterium]|nr:hypothetical protein [Acidimicrobiaceae bacterium]